MRAMVMLLQLCDYTVMLTSLRESFMGERTEKWRGTGERKRQQAEVNTRRILQPFVSFFFKQIKKITSILWLMLSFCQNSPLQEKRVCWRIWISILLISHKLFQKQLQLWSPRSFQMWWSLTFQIWWIRWEMGNRSAKKHQPIAQAWCKELGDR